MKLNARKVTSIIKDGVLGTTADGGGLYLQISGKGSASWLFRYQLNHQRRVMGLGPCESVSLAEAREQAAIIRSKIRQGIDPIQERQALEEEARGKNVTFGDCAQDYIKSHQASWKNAKHASQWQNTLATYALPVIGNLPPKEVTTKHLLTILQPIWSTKTETASRVRNRIELILDAAAAKGLRPSDNPARWRGHLDKLLARPSKIAKVRHHPALSYERIPELFSTLAGHQDLSAMALQLLILTATRTSEVVGASWSELDVGNRICGLAPIKPDTGSPLS